MNLEEANKQLEKLENEYEYWLNQKEALLSIVSPKSPSITNERVDGGQRTDKMLKYIELDDEKKINDTLDYIFKRKQNLLKWIENELEIMKKYGEVESVIIQIKENKIIKDKTTGKYRGLTWQEIANEVHWSVSFCRSVYRNYKKIRNVD